jgi:SAM-dependent methyltransferase
MKGKHWTETLFVDHPEAFLPWMEQMNEIASEQVDGLDRIFARHHVPEGGRVLDLGSGLGRISIGLAKLGYDVVGVDISPLYVKIAQKWAEKEGVSAKARFHKIDSRETSGLSDIRKNKFHAIISIATSIGFYGRNADLKIFRQLSKSASPGAILVIETANRDYLVRHFQDHGIAERSGIVWYDSRRLDLESSFMKNRWKFYRIVGRSLRLIADVPVTHRVYSIHELKEMIESSGWTYLESYGSLRTLSPLNTNTFHMTLVARKSSHQPKREGR